MSAFVHLLLDPMSLNIYRQSTHSFNCTGTVLFYVQIILFIPRYADQFQPALFWHLCRLCSMVIDYNQLTQISDNMVEEAGTVDNLQMRKKTPFRCPLINQIMRNRSIIKIPLFFAEFLCKWNVMCGNWYLVKCRVQCTPSHPWDGHTVSPIRLDIKYFTFFVRLVRSSPPPPHLAPLGS